MKSRENNHHNHPLVVVFLDIDGVLLPFSSHPESKAEIESNILPNRTFPNCTLQALAHIFQHIPAAEIVLSSTWRVQASFRNLILDEFRAFCSSSSNPSTDEQQLPKSFYDITDINLHTERQHEIYEWLVQYQTNMNNGKSSNTTFKPSRCCWVALDDEELLCGPANATRRACFENHVIHCDHQVGLTMEQAQEAVRLLQMQLDSQKE